MELSSGLRHTHLSNLRSPSLLEEINTSHESKVLCSAIRISNVSSFKFEPKQSVKSRPSCLLCKQAGRPSQHFLSKCKYLPQSDKTYVLLQSYVMFRIMTVTMMTAFYHLKTYQRLNLPLTVSV